MSLNSFVNCILNGDYDGAGRILYADSGGEIFSGLKERTKQFPEFAEDLNLNTLAFLELKSGVADYFAENSGEVGNGLKQFYKGLSIQVRGTRVEVPELSDLTDE